MHSLEYCERKSIMPESSAPASVAPGVRPLRLGARRAKAERAFRLVGLLAAGASVAELALEEGVSVRRMRQIIQDVMARRQVDPPPGFAQLQIARLSDALQVAHNAMMDKGDLRALDRVLKIVRELDRYHAFSASGGAALAADRAPRRLAQPPAARALPGPAASAEGKQFVAQVIAMTE
jgi:hypothetical protein